MDQGRDADHKVRAVLDRYWDGILAVHPLLATMAGDERFDDALPDPSADGRASAIEVHRVLLESLDAAAIDRADPDLRLGCELARHMAERDLRSMELSLYRLDAVTHMGDPWTVGPGTLLPQLAALQRVDTRERFERYEARLRSVPTFLASCEEVMREGVETGFVAPRVVVARAERQIRSVVDTPPDTSPALEPIAAEMTDERRQATELIETVVVPAFGRFLESLRAYGQAARDTIGLSALPDGHDLYAATAWWWTSLGTTVEEIHELGLSHVGALQEERRRVAQALGHSGPTEAASAYLAGGQGPSTPEALISLVHEQVDRSWEMCAGYFGRFPARNCEVRPVMGSREQDVLAYYQPAPDETRRGVYYVNTADLGERPFHRLAAWTYHEANPGHHFQIALEQEAVGRPALRRYTGEFASSAFVEGWGLYAERLADEMGLYQDDFERLGMLDQQAFRAARLVVDTGIHAFRMDRDTAIGHLEAAGIPKMEAVIEVDRYIAWPGQALTYKLGQIAIERWRADTSARLGDRFSLKAFHDRLLSLGSLPLSILEVEMGRFDG
jgi:uncharacterized protein (DUF885 family)